MSDIGQPRRTHRPNPARRHQGASPPGTGAHLTAQLRLRPFPLQILAWAVEQRAETWAGLEISRRVFPIQPNHGKPVVRVELKSTTWLVQIMIWNSGEAELETIRLADDRIVNKHYDLVGCDDLDVLLDEVVRLLVQDQVPEAAVTFYAPGSPTRQGGTVPSASPDGDAPTVM